MSLPFFILSAILVSLVLMQLNQRLASPIVALVDRWLRWGVFAFGAAYLCTTYDLVSRPFWALAGAFFLVWFLCETLYNWLAITAHSLSPLPLFPRYTANGSGEEWPVQPRLLKVREWLREQGFRQVQALKAEVATGVHLRVSVYQDAQSQIRLQVYFLPQASGAISVCFAATSVSTDGRRFLTDNLYVPFAGFYPENWFVERAPWRRSLPRLLARHRRRVAAAGATVEPLTADPLTDVNAIQHELDQLNTELGFLHAHPDREEHGKFTHEGRYRVWKEIWTLNYLGRSARYQ